jgi:undecaprenyl-diphosphatase
MAGFFKRNLVPLGMLVLGAGIFAAIAADVTQRGLLAQADPKIAEYLHARTQGWVVFAASALSGLGDVRILWPGAVIVGIVLARWRRWRELLTWAIGLLGSIVWCTGLKMFFVVPRPTRFTLYTFVPGEGFSFPSGHTMGATIAAGLLVILWMRMKKRSSLARWVAGGVVAVIGTLVAGSLVYVGVHYVTDVLGGLAMALAWLGVMRWTLPAAEERREQAYHCKASENSGSIRY